MVWDFFACHPQAVHQVNRIQSTKFSFTLSSLVQFLFLYSDRGVPDGFRFMHGYSSHTFKMVNDKNEFVWVKFHFRVNQYFQIDFRTNLVRFSVIKVSKIFPQKKPKFQLVNNLIMLQQIFTMLLLVKNIQVGHSIFKLRPMNKFKNYRSIFLI